MTNNDSTQKELSIILRSLIKLVQFIIFLIIQFPLLPLTIIGYILTVVKIMLYSKKHGLSATSN